jgi:hypothetical protein
MSAGSRAWAGLTHDAVLAQVGGEGQLELPQGLPPVLEQLMASCLAKEPSERCARCSQLNVGLYS